MLQSKKVAKLVGIDYGTKRVGVAVSDESGSIAFPRTTYANDNTLIPMLVTLIRNERAGAVVIGESKDKDGKDNPVMAGARHLGSDLEQAVAVVVHYEPEFYTSVEARRGVPSNAVDAQAAAIILNSYIVRTKK